MKHLGFAIFAFGVLIACPAVAQLSNSASYDLIDAIKKSDSDKAIQVLDSHPQGIVDTKDGDGNTGLIIAINRGDEQWTGFLLNKGADPNLAGKDGDTPLIVATKVSFQQAMDWLLRLGAKVDATNRMGETPLIIAVQQRSLPLVRLLLQHGADPDKTDHAAGYSARDYAQRDGRSREILSLINQARPKVDATASK